MTAYRRPAPSTKAGASPARKSRKARDDKPEKTKVVRDSFTMPQQDYAQIAELKRRLQEAGIHAKKSELLRAGLHALTGLDMKQLAQALAQLTPIKTGRPKKG